MSRESERLAPMQTSRFSTPLVPHPSLATIILAAAGILATTVSAPDAQADDAGKPLEPRAAFSASDAYWEAGLETSSTTYVNSSVGYWLGAIGLRIAAGYLGRHRHDLKLDVGYKFIDSGHWRHSGHILLGQTAGRDSVTDYDYAYVGLAYQLNYRGLFAQLGLGKDVVDRVGNLDGDPVIPVGTLLGYQYRFR